MNRFRDPGANHQKNTLAKNAAFIALTTIPIQPKKLLPFSKWSLAASQQNQTKNKLSNSPSMLYYRYHKNYQCDNRMTAHECKHCQYCSKKCFVFTHVVPYRKGLIDIALTHTAEVNPSYKLPLPTLSS